MTDLLLPPSVGIHDAPLHKLCINAQWWSHISAQIARLSYPEAWHGTDDQRSDAIEAIFDLLNVGLTIDDCEAAVTVDYPRHATMWHDEATIVSGGGLTSLSLAPAPYNIPGQFYNLVTYQSSIANGDSFAQDFMLDAGDYNFKVLGGQNQYGGKLDWYLDDGIIAFSSGMDWYNAAETVNVIKTGSLTIPTGGRHRLKGVVNGHNASSGAYFVPLVKYWLEYVP